MVLLLCSISPQKDEVQAIAEGEPPPAPGGGGGLRPKKRLCT